MGIPTTNYQNKINTNKTHPLETLRLQLLSTSLTFPFLLKLIARDLAWLSLNLYSLTYSLAFSQSVFPDL